MKHYLVLTWAVAAVLSAAAGCSSGKGAPAGSTPPGAAPQSAAVETMTLRKGALPQQVKLPGQLAAFEEVSIFPKVNGYVKDVFVDVGSSVHKGQLLMTLEAPELQQAATEAEERFARAKLEATISEENYRRMLQASRTPGAVSPMNLASLKAKADADSALCNAEKANWQMQETMLGYLQVTAPFNGVIAERNVHPGALVSAESHESRPMLDLQQIDHLRLQVDIPEGIAAALNNTDTITYYLSAYPGKKMTGRISRKSDLVNSQYRAERMELDVYNHDGKFAPGMYADVLFDSRGNPDACIVPRSAVVTSTERKYVIAIRKGKTVRVDVATGNESADQVEITGDLHPGERIVTIASDDLQEGIAIK
ncbi:MAG TPA: efflux RND transporter periplasmic adaptor subunit [Puia sp.]|nr:efflux RND transporter periplasmic adaptor subunit [Puia sp.]